MSAPNSPAITAAQALRRAKAAEPITSGSEAVDGLLGGGYRPGQIVEYYGASGTGKSQLAMQAALCGAKEGKKVLYVDTEGAFRPERVEEVAEARGWDSDEALRRVEYLRTESFQEQMEVV